MSQSVPLSVLDLTPIGSGSNTREALQTSVELAQLADRLGYTRYWFAEHHNTTGLASGAPEIMIAYIASRTTGLRVGSGGVMLPNHSPLKIIETFRLLEALYPGRIDLGLGRAPGTDTKTALALRRSPDALGADDYPVQLAELIAYDEQSFPSGHPFHGIQPVPTDVRMPPLWLLGSSGFSAQLAAQTGLGFAFAAHINRAAAIPALRAYRASFVPSASYPKPHAILALSVTVGETEAHARELAKINDLALVRLRTGRHGRYPTLAEAQAYQFSEQERALLAAMPLNYLAGDAASIHARIVEFQQQSQADEVMITTMLADPADRRRALVELAHAFSLAERPPITPFPAEAVQR